VKEPNKAMETDGASRLRLIAEQPKLAVDSR
jgi:hypothetical protein